MLVHEVSAILRRELKDPRLGFVTITGAEVSADLRHARVFFSVLGEESEREESTRILNRAAGFIRSKFAQRAQMRYVPELKFAFDHSLERGARISQLLEQVRMDEESAAGVVETGGGGDTES